MTRLIALLLLASPAMADTIGPTDMPSWPLSCELETLRITEPPLPGSPIALTAPGSWFGPDQRLPVIAPYQPAPVSPVPLIAAGLVSASGLAALAALTLRKRK